MHASKIRSRFAALAVGVAFVAAPLIASAGLMDSAVQMAKPLAEKFGVPVDMVSGLLDGGFDLQTVTQALLVDQAADSVGLGEIKDQLSGGSSIDQIASGLGVDPSVYAKDKVDGVLSGLTGGASDAASDAAGQAGDAAKDASDKAAGEMDKATDALKGLGK